MKKLITLILLVFINISLFAGIITKTYVFDEPQIIERANYSKIQIQGGVALGNPGDPAIPYINVSVLLPQNESISNIFLSFGKESSLGYHVLYPLQKQYPLSKMNNAVFTEPNTEIYGKSKRYPDKQFSSQSTHCLSGYSIGSLALTPKV